MKVSIVNYDNINSERIMNLLSEFDFAVKMITDEINLCTSDVIIMPDCGDLLKANRKLQLFNLSNVIKILNRKIIGINNGMFLMCSNIIGSNLCGLGLLHSDVYKFNETQNIILKNSDFNYTKHSCLNFNWLKGEINYKSDFYILENDNTCISSKINGLPVSLIDKYNNYIGINMDFGKDNKIISKLIFEAISL